ncbi:MAG: hypothetical protein WCA30_15815 [Dermatophilaceae bacterium]
MSRSRRLTAGAVAALVAAVLLPAAATGAPDGSLRGLVLTGEDTCGLKTVYVAPHAPYLFAPVRLLGEDFAPTRSWLHPYEVTVISGEGLKARHLVPGDTYTRPGAPPADTVTCDFFGATKEEGDFEIRITGSIRGQ